MINSDGNASHIVRFIAANKLDYHFFEKLKCDNQTVYVFDKEQYDYAAFTHFKTKYSFCIPFERECKI